MTHSGSATYTVFQQAQMLYYNTLSLLLLPLLQYTLIASFTSSLSFLSPFFPSNIYSQNIIWFRWSNRFDELLDYVIQGLPPWTQRKIGRWGNPNNIPREKGPLTWLHPERDQTVGQMWHLSPPFNRRGFMGHCLERGYCLQRYGML